MQFFETHEEENVTVIKLTLKEGFGFALPSNEKQQLNYSKDAKKILDNLSKDFSPVGLGFLISSLLIEYYENEYNGKFNMR